MTRTSDLVRKTAEGEQAPMRLSEIEELKDGVDGTISSKQTDRKFNPYKSESQNIYTSLQNFMRDVKQCVIKNQAIQLETALISIKKIIDAEALLEAVYQITIAYGHDEDYSISHPVNVMAYTLKMGRHMGYSQAKLTELALSALLYDIGLFLIPDNVISKKEPLSQSELSLVKRHPDMGKNLLYSFKDDYPWLIRAVYEHHERENGQGYPEGIKGDEISEYAKIIGICDSYEAMTHDRPHKKAIMQFVSVRELVETKNYSNKILKSFLDEISLYPIGSYVKLNNKSIGRVVATNADQPLKPVLSILYDGHGNRITEEKTINLKENPILVITGGVSREEYDEIQSLGK